MKKMMNEGDNLSRRDFLKRGALGILSLVGMSMMGSGLLSSCSKEDDENDLAGYDEQVEEDEKNKKKNQG